MKRMKNSLYASAALLIFSLLMIFYAIPTQISVKALLGGNSTIVNSRFFPYIVSGIVGVLSAVELAASAIQLSRLAKEGKKDEAKAPKGTLIAMVVFVLFVVYLLIFARFGFIISSAIVPPAVLFVLGSRKWQHYVSYYVVMAATYVIFVYALKISLP